MAFWLARQRDGQDSEWIQRFDPRFWTVNFPRPMMASVVTTAPDALRVDVEFHRRSDLAGLIWESEDRFDHPLLAYKTDRDYSRTTLRFRWTSSGILPLDAPLLIAGLAPGLKGANASGRPFTGDGAGPLLYGTLTELGLASRPQTVRITDHPSTLRADDGLQLHGCRISNAVRCLPPGTKPLPVEIRTCNRFIAAEVQAMPNLRVIVALGKVAHDAMLMALGQKASAARFAHAAEHRIENYLLIDSYHCSRYNQNTGRLTAPMFRAVFERAVQLLN